MSSILKALKKLEQEKNPNGMSAGAGVADEAAHTRANPWLPLLAGVVAGGTLVAMFVFFVGKNPAAQLLTVEPVSGGERHLAQASDSEVVHQGPAPVGEGVASGQGTVHPAGPSPEEFLPVVQQQPRAVPRPNPQQTPQEVETVKVVAPQKVSADVAQKPPVETSRVFSSTKAQPVILTGQKSVVDSAGGGIVDVRMDAGDIPRPGYEKIGAPPAPDLPFRVSEIFYAEGDTGSMAVVNDLPVMEGTLVDGALLKEIHPDYVVFEVGDALVEVPLASSDN